MAKVRYSKKDRYIVYPDHRNFVNYSIIGVSVLAITVMGVAYSVSLARTSEDAVSGAGITALQDSSPL